MTDMRFLCNLLSQRQRDSKDPAWLAALSSKITYIDPDLSTTDVQKAVTRLEWIVDPNQELEQLGKFLRNSFASSFEKSFSLTCEIEKKPVYQTALHLHCCDKSQVLPYVLKAHLLQGQRPIANRVLFCDNSTSIEQLDCFLQRCVGETSKDTCHLHCLVQPELLSCDMQDEFVRRLGIHTKHKSKYLLRIICTDQSSVVAQALSAYKDRDPLTLVQQESKQFYQQNLCNSLDAFVQRKNNVPFVQLFLSQNACAGKSHVLEKKAKELNINEKCFVHVPINTCTIDIDFLIEKFCSVSSDDLTVCFILRVACSIFCLCVRICNIYLTANEKQKRYTIHK
ncbi:hypothetical protein RFI_08414 [Reticulomyxa filosa]|uniref:Uncharacterized protein n=1 Tax=Reticulomyxa filosa TaxID=46433 RepID=X6NSH6_RETFI|nr:hypothetical protein RFI_08414 [Reticulomyxa filosa]|eukprot:ETO28709.1 hypothetical protein RFI_08414 [Reticulomyxa filosa]